jgi:uncharacterized protein YbaR (Trm112 family)
MFPQWLSEVIICPETKQQLKLVNNQYQQNDGVAYPIKNDILLAVYPEELSDDDARFNKMYNIWAPFYDLNEQVIVNYYSK